MLDKTDIKNKAITLTEENIKDMIYQIRGQKVMLDFELADIYGYDVKSFNRQVKNNIEKFDEDFMFKLSKNDVEELMRCKNYTSRIWNNGNVGGRRYTPYAFTEQGIYMLMTVLKGDIAIKQSKVLIRLFKQMKDYLLENNTLFLQTKEYVDQRLIPYDKKLDIIMRNFKNNNSLKQISLYNNQRIESDIAYKEIFSLAKKTIHIIDDYISLKTLQLLKCCNKKIKITIFSDNKAVDEVSLEQLNDFEMDTGMKINLIKSKGLFHDRYIILDYKTKAMRVFDSGPSIKDAGKRRGTIIRRNYEACSEN